MAKRLTRLTPEQEAMLPVIRDEWVAVGLSTEPADRSAAEAGIALAYQAAGLAPPRCIWVPSPLGGAIAQAILRKAGVWAGVRDGVWAGVSAGVSDGVRDGVWAGVGAGVRDGVSAGVSDGVWAGVSAGVSDGVRAGVSDGVGAGVSAGVWAGVSAGVSDGVGAGVSAGVSDGVRAGVSDGVGAGVRDWWKEVAYGQHDAPWLSFYDAFRRFGLADIVAPLDGLTQVARSAGWCWLFRDVAILTERPLAVHVERDRNGVNRLHCEDGPAIVYPDGWGVHSWHGIRVPADVIETPPESITAERIRDERNAEVRRVLIERVGTERYIALMGAQKVAADDWGTLWRVDDEYAVVELLNSTPEPDGSVKTYWIRVPHTRERADADTCVVCGTSLAIVPQTPRAAIAWGYSVCESDYRPAVMS